MSANLCFLIYIFFHLVCLPLLINFNYADISSIYISSKEPLVLGIVGGVALAHLALRMAFTAQILL